MKKLVALVLVALPFLSYGMPLQTAQQLARTLQSISLESGDVAQKASMNGNLVRARRFGDVSFYSGQLERDLRQGVVRPLRQGESIRRVANNLQNMNHEFQRLNAEIAEIQQMPITLERSIANAKALHRELRQELQGGGIDPIHLVECRAADEGFEEHILRPHVGVGRTVREAERNAIVECQRYHGRCRIVSCR